MADKSDKDKIRTYLTILCKKCSKEVRVTYLHGQCIFCALGRVCEIIPYLEEQEQQPLIKIEQIPSCFEKQYEQTQLGSHEDREDAIDLEISFICNEQTQGVQEHEFGYFPPCEDFCQPMFDQNMEEPSNSKCCGLNHQFHKQIFLKVYNAFVLSQQHMQPETVMQPQPQIPKQLPLKRPLPELVTAKERCDKCSKKTGIYGFNCNYCHNHYCNTHRIPQHHDCIGDLKSQSKQKLKVLMLQGKAYQIHKGKVLQI